MSHAAEARDVLTVRRARVRGGGESMPLRRALEAALADCAGRDLGLPTRALLILPHTAPGVPLVAVGVDTRRGEFRRVVLEALRDARRRAVRPWHHSGCGNGLPVLFADRAELAACLVREWLAGTLSGRWWADAVLGGGTDSIRTWWRRELLPRGDLVPAVLGHLGAIRAAADWVRRLDPAELAVAAGAVEAAYGLAPNAIAGEPRRALAPVAAALSELARARAELARRVPEIDAVADSLPQQRLLALGLGMQRDPAWCRRAGLGLALAALETGVGAAPAGRTAITLPTAEQAAAAQTMSVWVAQAIAEQPADGRGCINADVPVQQDDRSPAAAGSWSEPAGVTAEQPVDGSGRIDAAAPARLGDASPATVGRRYEPAHRPPTAGHRRKIGPGGTAKVPPPSNLAFSDTHASSPMPPNGPAAEARDRLAAAPSSTSASVALRGGPACRNATMVPTPVIETRCGGLLYLLNVALSLGLYGDFTQPRRPGIALSPWDWLALVGERWLGRDLRTDPLWRLFGQLAVRPDGQPPGTGFAPPDAWLMPEDWPLPWGAVPVRIEVHRGRLRLHHPAGFLLADVPCRAAVSPRVQARGLLARWPPLTLDGGPRTTRPVARGRQPGWQPRPIPLERWLDWLLPYLEARLALALGSDDPTTVPLLVCRHRARVEVSATALDVHLSLAELPMAIRIAGLDRDPGWIPAAGRTLAFHFR